MIKEIAYHNGVWGDPARMTVPLEDRGYLFGEGVYEVVYSYNHIFWGLEEHLDRLERSLNELEMPHPCGRQELTILLQQAVNRLSAAVQVCYIQITRGGEQPRTHGFHNAAGRGSLTIIARDYDDDLSYMEQGRSAILLPDLRWGRCDIKTTNLIPNELAATAAARAGSFAAILHRDGFVTEANAYSVFIVRSGCLVTRPAGPDILPSVCRTQILAYAPRWGIPLEQRRFTVEELLQADEVLLFSSSKHPMPIVRVEETPIAGGRVGPLARRIFELYEAELTQTCGPRPRK
ncbi:MAG: aminotransferase class IV [Firmicutes bacterium]|nr:aminotransferase class IV [Bacillota bacterium]